MWFLLNSWDRGLFSLLFAGFAIIVASYCFKELNGLENVNWSIYKLLLKDLIDGREDEYVWLEAINTLDDLYMRQGMYAGTPIQIYGLLVPGEHGPRTGPAKTGPDRGPSWSKMSDRGPNRNGTVRGDLEGVMLEYIVHPFTKPVDHSDAADMSLESVQIEADGATNLYCV
nr:plant cysteine oxidase 3 [Tanacetum cinerariifolium]